MCVLFAVCALLFTHPVSAFNYENEAFHYEFQLPDDWAVVDPAILADAKKATVAAGGDSPDFIVGFFKTGAAKGIYPYVLIAHDEAQVSFSQVVERFTGKLSVPEGKLPAQINDLRFEETVVDKSRRMLIIPSTVHIPTIETIKGLVVIFLGKPGLVHLYFYTLEHRYEDDLPIFRSITESFMFDPDFEADELGSVRLHSRPSWLTVLIRTFVGALIGLGVYLIVRFLLQRRKSRAKKPA